MSIDPQNIERRLADLEDRLTRLEAGQAPVPFAAARVEAEVAHQAADDLSLPALTGLSASRMVFLLGRSIMVLGGAFLLRFITESGLVPPVVGFALGLVYALLMITLADRRGKSHTAEGGVHGLTGMMIAFPLLYESITTLQLVNPMVGGLALLMVTGAGLFVAWHRRLRLLAWAFALPAVGLAVVLGLATPHSVFFGWIILVLGCSTVLLAASRGWTLKQWLVAALANVVIFRLSVMAADQATGVSSGTLAPEPVRLLCLGLLTIYLGLFTVRTLVLGQGVQAFCLVQSVAVLAIGFGGSLHIAEAVGYGSRALALFAVATAVSSYAVSFTIVRRRLGRGRAFFYFASLALMFLLLGTRAVVHGRLLTATWLALGVFTAILGARYDRFTLRTHSVIYLLLASIQVGFVRATTDAFAAGAHSTWHQTGWMGAGTLLVIALAATILNRQRGNQETGRWRRWPRLLAVVILVPGLTQFVVMGIVNLAGDIPPNGNPQVIAAIRTGVISCVAIGLALVGRRTLLRDLRWLVYPVLGLGLLKIVVEDLRVGSPLELFFAFAMIGGTLILAPRLVRRSEG